VTDTRRYTLYKKYNAVGIKNKQPDRTCPCWTAACRRTEMLIIILLLLYDRGACVRVKPEIRRGSRCDAHNPWRIVIRYCSRTRTHIHNLYTYTYLLPFYIIYKSTRLITTTTTTTVVAAAVIYYNIFITPPPLRSRWLISTKTVVCPCAYNST